MKSLDAVEYSKNNVDYREIGSPRDSGAKKRVTEFVEDAGILKYKTSDGEKEVSGGGGIVLDLGSRMTGQRFDLTQDEIDLLFSYPSPEVKVRIENYDVSIYKYDAEVSGDKVFYTNVLIYQDGKRYHVNLDVDRTLTENQAIIYRTEEPIVTEEQLNTEVETLNGKIDKKQNTLVTNEESNITLTPQEDGTTLIKSTGGGTEVYVDGVKQDKLYFDSDPQTQLNTINETLLKCGFKLNIVSDNTNYKYTFQLLNKGNEVLSEYTIDLPNELALIDVKWDSTTNSIIFTLQNGNEVSVPIGSMISGYVTEEYVDNGLADKQDKIIYIWDGHSTTSVNIPNIDNYRYLLVDVVFINNTLVIPFHTTYDRHVSGAGMGFDGGGLNAVHLQRVGNKIQIDHIGYYSNDSFYWNDRKGSSDYYIHTIYGIK